MANENDPKQPLGLEHKGREGWVPGENAAQALKLKFTTRNFHKREIRPPNSKRSKSIVKVERFRKTDVTPKSVLKNNAVQYGSFQRK